MKLTVNNVAEHGVYIRDMKDGDFAVVVSGQFVGEVIFCNVAGWHSLTANRYWPSDYVLSKDPTYKRTSYIPEMYVRLLEPNSTLTVSA